jgi:uncharacterized protein
MHINGMIKTKDNEYYYTNNQISYCHPEFNNLKKVANSYYIKKYEWLKENVFVKEKKKRETYSLLSSDDVYNLFISSRKLLFEVTENCNLKCSYCCYGKHYNVENNENRKTNDLDFNNAKLLIDYVLPFWNKKIIERVELNLPFGR